MDGKLNSHRPTKPWQHLAVTAATILIVGIPYSKVSGTYFCLYDDFDEIHRAVFEDSRDPWHIFTTPHLCSANYRPLNRAMTWLTYWAGHGRPVISRIRNLTSRLAAPTPGGRTLYIAIVLVLLEISCAAARQPSEHYPACRTNR
jgi:hypothetical protein